MSEISQLILNYDLLAVERVKSTGSAAISELEVLFDHDDPVVRILVATALGEITHANAYTILLKHIGDKDNSVATTVADQLIRHKFDIGVQVLLKALQGTENTAVQRQLILAIGTLSIDGRDRDVLQDFCRSSIVEQNAPACHAALSKLGVVEEQLIFSKYLVNIKDLEAFELTEYIEQPWLLRPLGQLLHFVEPLQTLGDPPPGFPSVLRICDKAVVLIAKISQHPLSFQTHLHAHYTSEQIAEAARVATLE